jgi:hypothetical protein
MSLRQGERSSKVGIDRYSDSRASSTFTLATKAARTASVAATDVTE